jgi:mycofactocin precursor
MSDDTVVSVDVDETEPVAAEDDAADDALLESLLVEEVSIDGMCGVY